MKKGKKTKNIIISATAAAVVLSGVGLSMFSMKSESSKQNEMEVQGSGLSTYCVKPVEMVEYAVASGFLKGGTESVVKVESDAPVLSVLVNCGDYVEKGDVLFTLDSSEYEALLSEAENELSIARAAEAYNKKENESAVSDARADLEETQQAMQYTLDEAVRKRDDVCDKIEHLKSEYNVLMESIEDIEPSVVSDENNETTDENNELATVSDEINELLNISELLSNKNEKEANFQRLAELEAEIEILCKEQEALDDAVVSAETNIKETLKMKEAAVNSAQSRIDLEKFDTTLEKIEKEINCLKEKIAGCVVKASTSGILSELNVVTGESVMGRAAVISDSESIYAVVKVKESDVRNIKKGMDAVVRTSFDSNKYSGKILNISKSSKVEMNQNSGYETIIEITDAFDELYLGMTVTAEINIISRENSITVPLDALREKEGKTYVFKADSDTQEKVRVEIETGICTGDMIEVVSGDIAEGDILYLTAS